MTAPIPAFNYMDGSKNGIRISPSHFDSHCSSSNSSSRTDDIITTSNAKSILEYQNIQQQCDTKLLKELQTRRQRVNFQSTTNETEKENQCKHDDVQKLVAVANKKKDIERLFAVAATKQKQHQQDYRMTPTKKRNKSHHQQYYNIIENENIRSKSPLIYRYNKNKLQQQQKLATKYYLLPMQDIVKQSKAKSSKSSSNSSGGSKHSSTNSQASSTPTSLDLMLSSFEVSKSPDNFGPESGSYLGPFNFRQLLRPTQGPTESLRKRKHIVNSNSPPPLQRGKNK